MLDLSFFIGAAALLYGLYKTFQVIILYRKIKASSSWTTGRGSVTGAAVKENYWTSGRHFWAEIKYAYKVSGVEYSGKLRNETFWKSELSAKDFTQQHPVRSALPFRYNPDKPGESVTEYDRVSSYDRFIVIFYLLFGLAMLLTPLFAPK